jgi:hypothetical protein
MTHTRRATAPPLRLRLRSGTAARPEISYEPKDRKPDGGWGHFRRPRRGQCKRPQRPAARSPGNWPCGRSPRSARARAELSSSPTSATSGRSRAVDATDLPDVNLIADHLMPDPRHELGESSSPSRFSSRSERADAQPSLTGRSSRRGLVRSLAPGCAIEVASQLLKRVPLMGSDTNVDAAVATRGAQTVGPAAIPPLRTGPK